MITIYFGKSASGKDTILKKCVEAGAKPIISYTTRPMRPGEVDGREYHFVTASTFASLYESDVLFEARDYTTSVNGKSELWSYGSPIVDANDNWVAIMDVQGCQDYIQAYGADKIALVYVKADDDIRKERCKFRGDFDESEWTRRLADDNKKFSKENVQKLCNLLGREITIINNNGDKPLFSKMMPEV